LTFVEFFFVTTTRHPMAPRANVKSALPFYIRKNLTGQAERKAQRVKAPQLNPPPRHTNGG
jgi:hypothetical protein